MSFFRRPGPRFAAEAVAIILAAAIPGSLHLVWWQIGVCVVVVLLAAVWIESWLGQQPPAPRERVETVQLPPVIEEPPRVRVLQAPQPAPVPAPVPEPEPEREPQPEPEPAPVAVATPPARVAGPPFNVWELERALNAAGATSDEQTFLLHYLRDYAGADGNLPAEFDDLVRESFPALL